MYVYMFVMYYKYSIHIYSKPLYFIIYTHSYIYIYNMREATKQEASLRCTLCALSG